MENQILNRKFKSFTYATGLEWVENRTGTLKSTGKPEIRVASPPEFKGESGVWTPEDLFVAAIEICTMTTFLSFAQRKGLPLRSYRSSAEGLLEFVDGKYRFTRVVVRPLITVADESAVPLARTVLDESHHHCLIANSVQSEVLLEPEFSAGG
jgi:organic hydroperoxide reductase OsmC/OhrA